MATPSNSLKLSYCKYPNEYFANTLFDDFAITIDNSKILNIGLQDTSNFIRIDNTKTSINNYTEFKNNMKIHGYILDSNDQIISFNDIKSYQIKDSNILTNHILDSSITTSKIANNSVTNVKIADGSVNTSKIQSNAIRSHHILDRNITSNLIELNAVDTYHITAKAVTGDKIADQTITTNNIALGAITADLLQEGTITSLNIVDDSVTSDKIVSLDPIKVNSGYFQTGKYIFSDIETNYIIAKGSNTLGISSVIQAYPEYDIFYNDYPFSLNGIVRTDLKPSHSSNWKHFVANNNSNSVFYVIKDGRTYATSIGVNTHTPTEVLEVNGNMRSKKAIMDIGSEASPAIRWISSASTGIYSPVTNEVGFVTNGLERMRISQNGFIGFNTKTPQEQVDINGSTKVRGRITLSSNGYAVIQGRNETNTGNVDLYLNPGGGNVFIGSGNMVTQGNLELNSNYGVLFNQKSILNANDDHITFNVSSNMYLATGGDLSFTVRSNVTLNVQRDINIRTSKEYGSSVFTYYASNYLVNTPLKMQLGFTDAQSLKLSMIKSYTSAENRDTMLATFSGSPEISMNSRGIGIRTNNPQEHFYVLGNIYASGSITPGSDDRIKINEEFITNASDTLNKLRPQIYDKWDRLDYASNDEAVLFKESGFIAQEVFYDAPELRHLVRVPGDANLDKLYNSNITTSFDPKIDPEYKDWGTHLAGFNYIGLIPYIVKSLQEKDETIKNLIARVTDLENRV